eukprot:scaffold1124_cov361-Prasinococcus_capsulatus_cf.AAC.2
MPLGGLPVSSFSCRPRFRVVAWRGWAGRHSAACSAVPVRGGARPCCAWRGSPWRRAASAGSPQVAPAAHRGRGTARARGGRGRTATRAAAAA